MSCPLHARWCEIVWLFLVYCGVLYANQSLLTFITVTTIFIGSLNIRKHSCFFRICDGFDYCLLKLLFLWLKREDKTTQSLRYSTCSIFGWIWLYNRRVSTCSGTKLLKEFKTWSASLWIGDPMWEWTTRPRSRKSYHQVKRMWKKL
jgi:hypothetical protein